MENKVLLLFKNYLFYFILWDLLGERKPQLPKFNNTRAVNIKAV